MVSEGKEFFLSLIADLMRRAKLVIRDSRLYQMKVLISISALRAERGLVKEMRWSATASWCGTQTQELLRFEILRKWLVLLCERSQHQSLSLTLNSIWSDVLWNFSIGTEGRQKWRDSFFNDKEPATKARRRGLWGDTAMTSPRRHRSFPRSEIGDPDASLSKWFLMPKDIMIYSIEAQAETGEVRRTIRS